MRLERSPNVRALAWALGIMALLGGMATTRHHLQMMDGHLGGAYATWQHAMSQELPHWIFWALAIPIVYLFVDRVARQRGGRLQVVAAHVAFAALLFVL